MVRLHLSSWRRAWPLPSPSSRWPLQPGTCSWRAAARKAPIQESSAWCVLQSHCMREVSAARKGSPEPPLVESARVRRGPRSLKPEPPPHPPGEPQKSRGLCAGGGAGMMDEGVWRKSLRWCRGRVLFCPPGAALKLKESLFHFHFTMRGRKQSLLSADCVSDPVPWLFVGLKGTGQVDQWPLYLRK